MADLGQNLTIQDLRAIMHGLKMATFAFVEESAQDQVRFMIAALPTPEQLGKISEQPKEFNSLVEQVGKIMQLVENYAERGAEFKARFITKKKLPPRYKTLTWRPNKAPAKDSIKEEQDKWKQQGQQKQQQDWFNKNVEKKEDGMQQAASINIVKSLIKASSAAENKGQAALSGKLIRCAKKVQNDSITEPEFIEAVRELEIKGFTSETKQVIAALNPSPSPVGVGSGVAAVGRQVGQAVDQAAGKAADKLDAGAAAVGNWFKNKWQGAKDLGSKVRATYQEAAWTTKVQSTMNQMNEVIGTLKKAVANATAAPEQQKSLQAILDRYTAASAALAPAIQLAQVATQQTAAQQPPALPQQPPALPQTQAAQTESVQPQSATTPTPAAQPKKVSPQAHAQIKGLLNNGWTKQDIINYVNQLS